METQMWRVVCEDGTTRSVIVEDRGGADDGRYQYTVSGVYLVDRSPRLAVGRWCAMESHALSVVEIVAPGALTAAEKVQAEQDRCVHIADLAMADAERRQKSAGDRRDWDAVQETEGAQNAIARVRLSIREGQ